MYDYDGEINQILKNSGSKILEGNDYDHRFEKYRELLKQSMEKDWYYKLYVKRNGGNEEETQRLIDLFVENVELENYEIPGKDAGISWIRLGDRYFDDDALIEEWEYFVDSNIDPTQYKDYNDGSNTELDESILNENDDYKEEFRDRLSQIMSLIDQYQREDLENKIQATAAIMDIIMDLETETPSGSKEYKLVSKLSNESAELKDRCLENAEQDDSNAQYRRLESSEIDWESIDEAFDRSWDYSPSDLIGKYYSGGKELILDNVIEICKEYLESKGYNLDSKEEKNNYSGEDTELDESFLKEVEDQEELDRQILNLYNELLPFYNEGIISDNKFDYYIKNMVDNYYEFEKLYDYLTDEVIYDTKSDYENDKDNWPEEYDWEATREYCYNNYSNEELLEYYIAERFIDSFINEIRQIIYNNYVITEPQDKKSISAYSGEDTELDESLLKEDYENADLPESVKEVIRLTKLFDQYDNYREQDIIVEELYKICSSNNYDDFDENLFYDLKRKADEFRMELVYRALEDSDNMVYRSPTWEDVDYDDLANSFWRDFSHSTYNIMSEYADGAESFVNEVKDICESIIGTENKTNDELYSGEDTELDESVNWTSTNEKDNIKKTLDLCNQLIDDNDFYNNEVLYDIYTLCNRSSIHEMLSYIDDYIQEMRDRYDNDEENWGDTIYDEDETYNKCYDMDIADLITYYSNEGIRGDFINDVKKILNEYFNEELLKNNQYSGEDTELDESYTPDEANTLLMKYINGYRSSGNYVPVSKIITLCMKMFNSPYNYQKALYNKTDEFVGPIRDYALEDDDNAQYRRPDWNEVNEDRIYDNYLDALSQDICNTIINYSSESPEEFVATVNDFVREYLEGKSIDDYPEDTENYSGDDTELDESYSLEDKSDFLLAKKLFDLTEKLMSEDTTDRNYNDNDVYNVFSWAEQIYYRPLNDYVSDLDTDMRNGYMGDSDNWGDDIYDSEATTDYVYNMTYYDLLVYADREEIELYIDEVYEILTNHANVIDNSYSGEDTELDESVLNESEEKLEIKDEYKEMIETCLNIEADTMISHLEDYCYKLCMDIRDNYTWSDTTPYKPLNDDLNNLYERFFDSMIEETRNDSDNVVYRSPTEDDVDYEVLRAEYDDNFRNNTKHIVNKYSSDFYKDVKTNIRELIEKTGLINTNNLDFDYDNQEMIDESVGDQKNVNYIYFLTKKDIYDFTDEDLYNILVWAMNCDEDSISEYATEIYDSGCSSYCDDSDNWGEDIYDDDATSEIIDNMSLEDMIRKYAIDTEIKEYAKDVLDTITKFFHIDDPKILFKDDDRYDTGYEDEYTGEDTELDESVEEQNFDKDFIFNYLKYHILHFILPSLYALRNNIENNHFSSRNAATHMFRELTKLEKYQDKPEIIQKLCDINDEFFTNVIRDVPLNHVDDENLIDYASEKTIEDYCNNLEVLETDMKEFAEGNEEFRKYNGEDTELDESVKNNEESNEKLLNRLLQDIFEFQKVSTQSDSLSVKKMEYFAKMCAQAIDKLELEVGVVDKLKHYNDSLRLALRTKAFDQFSRYIEIEDWTAEQLMDRINNDYMISELISQFSSWGVLYKYCDCLAKEKGAIENRLSEKDKNHLIYNGEDTELDESVEEEVKVGDTYKDKNGEVYYVSSIEPRNYWLTPVKFKGKEHDLLFVGRAVFHKFFTKFNDLYDGSETELDESEGYKPFILPDPSYKQFHDFFRLTSYGKISAVIDDGHIYCWDSGYAHHERVIKYIEESIDKPVSDNAIWVRFKQPNLCWVSAAYFNEYTDDELEDLPQQDFEKDLETNPIIRKYFPKGVKIVRFDNLVESSNKEMSKLDKLIALHKKSPDEDISDLAREIAGGNVEEYISLMKEYYRHFEK